MAAASPGPEAIEKCIISRTYFAPISPHSAKSATRCLLSAKAHDVRAPAATLGAQRRDLCKLRFGFELGKNWVQVGVRVRVGLKQQGRIGGHRSGLAIAKSECLQRREDLGDVVFRVKLGAGAARLNVLPVQRPVGLERLACDTPRDN
eukprot:6175927-Pleurochrysis_carterae.AAC.1